MEENEREKKGRKVKGTEAKGRERDVNRPRRNQTTHVRGENLVAMHKARV